MLRTALVFTSLVNAVAGLGLAGLYLKLRGGGDVPVVVLLVAVCLLAQGGYTVGYLRDWWDPLGARATQLFVVGESAAAMAGVLGTVQGVLYNLNPTNGDLEFGPLMAALLIGIHAAVGLTYAARVEDPRVSAKA